MEKDEVQSAQSGRQAKISLKRIKYYSKSNKADTHEAGVPPAPLSK
jgi:hypothetical protein